MVQPRIFTVNGNRPKRYPVENFIDFEMNTSINEGLQKIIGLFTWHGRTSQVQLFLFT